MPKTDRVRRVITLTDDEGYWLRRIAEQMEASSTPDGWAIAQTVAAFASTIGTLILAVGAVYIAWKSHELNRMVADAEAVRVQREERRQFSTAFQNYLRDLPLAWSKTPVGDTGPSGDTYSEITVLAMMLGSDKNSGAHLLLKRLNKLELTAGAWPRSNKSVPKLGDALATLVNMSTLWAKDGLDDVITEVDFSKEPPARLGG